MPEVNEAIPMPLGHGALAIGERRKLGHSLRERRDRAYVLPNSFKSALVPFFANIPLRTGWRGEMPTCSTTPECWTKTLAADGGTLRGAGLRQRRDALRQDLPQPLLWPQLLGQRGEKSQACSAFNPTIGRSSASAPARSSARPNAGHYHYAALAKKLIDDGYQIARLGEDNKAGKDHRAALSGEQRAGAVIWRVKAGAGGHSDRRL